MLESPPKQILDMENTTLHVDGEENNSTFQIHDVKREKSLSREYYSTYINRFHVLGVGSTIHLFLVAKELE